MHAPIAAVVAAVALAPPAPGVDTRVGPPVWAPRGDRIAWIDETGRLTTVRADGTDRRVVLGGDSGEEAQEFSWSPEGKRLAVGWYPPGDGAGERFGVVPAAGGRRTVLHYSPSGGDISPYWAPRGDEIAIVDWRGVWLVSASGRLHRHISDRHRVDELAWSPDGSRLAYTWLDVTPSPYTQREPPGDVVIEVTDPVGSPVATLEPEDGARMVSDIGWVPDGLSLSYVTMPSTIWDGDDPETWGPPTVHIAAINGSSRIALGEPGDDVAWSVRGRLAYASDFLDARSAVGATSIQFALRDGTLTGTLALAHHVQWSPNGRRFSFERRGAIYVADELATHVHRVATGGDASWAPDGKRLAFRRLRCGENGGAFVVSVLEGPPRRLSGNHC